MQCEVACDGEQAMDIIEPNQDISIIITDLQMPVLNGFQMIQKLQDKYKSKSKRNFAIIVITGNGGTSEAIKALQYGAMDFIKKPISPIACGGSSIRNTSIATTRCALS